MSDIGSPKSLSQFAGSAAIAGMITKSVCAPFDRIRLLYQVQGMFSGPKISPSVPKSRNHPSAVAAVHRVKYGSLLHTAKTIYAEEGLVGFWRGNGMNIIRAAVVYAIKFGTNDWIKQRMIAKKARRLQSTEKETAYKRNVLITGVPVSGSAPNAPPLGVLALLKAGGVAGLTQKAVSYPLDLVTVRIALGVNTSTLAQGEKTYDSILGCIKRIKATEGYIGFYKGFTPTLLTGVPYVMLQMTFFDLFKRRIVQPSPDGSSSSPGILQLLITSGFAGSLAGVAAQTIVFPGDTIRKRMMSNGIDGRPRMYSNSWDCACKIVCREGFRAFYSGILPLCLRALPSGAVQFASYELCKALLA